MIDERHPVPLGTVSLMIDRRRFLTNFDEITRLVVRLTGAVAEATLETPSLVVHGALALREVELHPRRARVHAGWLTVHVGSPVAAHAEGVAVAVRLPEGMLPREVEVLIPCDELTFELLTVEFVTPSPRDARRVMVAPDARVPVHRTPAGPVVAVIAPAAGAPLGGVVRATVLEERGGWLRVRVGPLNHVEGWVRAEAMRPAPPDDDVDVDLGEEPPARTTRHVRCPGDVPIVVVGSAGRQEVGRFKPGATIQVQATTLEDLTEIDLGAGELPVYVPTATIAPCAR